MGGKWLGGGEEIPRLLRGPLHPARTASLVVDDRLRKVTSSSLLAGSGASARSLRRGISSPPLCGGIRVLLLVSFLCLIVWASAVAHRRVEALARFRIEPALCRTIAMPPWLAKEDVEEIRRETGLLEASLPSLDPATAERLVAGHARSAWVKRVAAVELAFPNRAAVALEIRKPVAGVLVDGKIVLLDDEGVRLPGLHKNAPKGLGYVLRRIDGVKDKAPPPGENWSAAVREGVAVVNELLAIPWPLERALEVLSVDVSGVAGGGSVLLYTAGGAVIEWGRSAQHEFGPLGPTLLDKVRKLERALDLHPGLAGLTRVKLQFPDLVVEETLPPQGG